MAHKARAVFTAEPEQLRRVRSLVRAGKFESTSAFLREAIDDKLRRLEDAVMAAQLERACDDEQGDDALLHAQAWSD